jgi:radical SAM-linked protein
MRMVVQYKKEERVKYISHLDLMRTVHRALRRAKIPVAFSKGYNPQPRVAFAPPLSVGMTSQGEYLDIILDSPFAPEMFCQEMNKVLPKGITMLNGIIVDDSLPSLMSLIQRALYSINIYPSIEDFTTEVERFLEQREITIKKKTKKGERYMDIRPMIHRLELANHADSKGLVIKTILSAGSMESLNPRQMLHAMFSFIDIEGNYNAILAIHRMDMYLYQDGKWITPLELEREG